MVSVIKGPEKGAVFGTVFRCRGCVPKSRSSKYLDLHRCTNIHDMYIHTYEVPKGPKMFQEAPRGTNRLQEASQSFGKLRKASDPGVLKTKTKDGAF